MQLMRPMQRPSILDYCSHHAFGLNFTPVDRIQPGVSTEAMNNGNNEQCRTTGRCRRDSTSMAAPAAALNHGVVSQKVDVLKIDPQHLRFTELFHGVL